MDLSDKLERALEVKIISLERKISKRNKVFGAEVFTANNQREKFIVKVYEEQPAGNEVFILHMLNQHGLRVPRIIWYDDLLLVTEHIDGVLLAELLTDRDSDQELWINALAGWLYELHNLIKTDSKNQLKETCLCKADLNLRNFIFNGRVFYGIDFENVCFFPPERDLGVICAFILNNDPIFAEWKYYICSALISCYNRMLDDDRLPKLNPDLTWFYLIEELKAAAVRREQQRGLILSEIKKINRSSIF